MATNSFQESHLELCIYCNALIESDTKEHVPPKCCFPKGTEGLTTVPACTKCNSSFSRDDEYFRDTLIMSKECSEHPQAKELLRRVYRNLEREESKGYRLKLADSLSHCLVEYSPGLPEPGFENSIDLQRIGNVVSKTVRGLLWSKTGLRLPESYGIIVVPSFNFDFLPTRLMAQVAQVEARERRTESERASIGKGAFEHWWAWTTRESDKRSEWVLRFYEGHYFVCFIVPKKECGLDYFRSAFEQGLISVWRPEA